MSLACFAACFFSAFAHAQKHKQEKKQHDVVLTTTPLSTQDSALIESLFFAGIKEKIASNSLQAAAFFEKILAINPSHAEANYELAKINFFEHQLEKAKKYAENATAAVRDNEWYWFLLANIYQEQKDFPLLNGTLDELIKLRPDKIEYQFEKANCLVALGKPEEALKLYDKLEEQAGFSSEISNARQLLLIENGNINAAEQELLKSIEKDPENQRFYLQLGDLYFNSDSLEKSILYYKKAREINPSNTFINFALADIYNKQNKDAEAFKEIQDAFAHPELELDQKIKVILSYFRFFSNKETMHYAEQLAQQLTVVHSDDAKSFSIYGDVLFQEQNFAKASDAYEKALLLNKEVYAVWDQLLRIKLGLNEASEVIKYGEEALSYFPNQSHLYLYLGLAYMQQEEYNKAVSYLNNVLSYQPEKELKIQVYASLGDAFQHMSRYKESAEAYEEVLKLDKNNVYALNNYAYYLALRSENLEKAEQMSKRANELMPDNASYMDTYSWVLFKQGKYKDALVWIEGALKNDTSKSAVLTEHYGDILYFLGDIHKALELWKKAQALGESGELLKRKINEKKYFE